jgi:ATP-dependent Clp protease adaptor protein ClpS
MKQNIISLNTYLPSRFRVTWQAARPFEEDIEEEEIDLDEALLDYNTTTGVYLVVLNDDHNTFDWVIRCFMEVLEHTSEQAEQLAYIVHTKGKATVKNGSSVEELLPFKVALCDRGLLAEIEGATND